jgi:hypothetical protein
VVVGSFFLGLNGFSSSGVHWIVHGVCVKKVDKIVEGTRTKKGTCKNKGHYALEYPEEYSKKGD